MSAGEEKMSDAGGGLSSSVDSGLTIDPHDSTVVGAIWAQTRNGVIGHEGDMPWHLPEDLKHFASVTMGHPVIMGRRTWESIPEKYRPFSGRTNIVLTSDMSFKAEGGIVDHSLFEAVWSAREADGSEEIWIVGGGRVYCEAMPMIERILITQVDLETDGDTHAPELDENFRLISQTPEDGSWLTSRTGTRYRFEEYRRALNLNV